MSSLLETLLGTKKNEPSPVCGMALRNARVRAWARGHAEADVVHAASVFFALRDVEPMLARRGVHALDVEAVVDQLLDEIPASPETGPQPVFSKALERASERSVLGGHMDTALFVEGLAAALPRELGFARDALASSARDIAAFFGGTTSTSKGQLTLEAWSPDLAGVVGLMQKQSDERFKPWAMGPQNLFIALVTAKKYHDAFRARGVDVAALLREWGSRVTERQRKRYRSPPQGFVPELTPSFLALVLRAERAAAADRTEVRLHHVLSALHDEPDLEEWVARLAG